MSLKYQICSSGTEILKTGGRGQSNRGEFKRDAIVKADLQPSQSHFLLILTDVPSQESDDGRSNERLSFVKLLLLKPSTQILKYEKAKNKMWH